MRFLVVFTATAIFALLTASASAQSLKIKQMQQDSESRLAEQASDIPEVCGKDIAIRIDWDTFSEADYESNRSIAGYCSHAMTALREICRSSLGKEAAQTKLTALECARGPERRGAISENGIYRYEFTWDDSDQTSWHIDFLQDNL